MKLLLIFTCLILLACNTKVSNGSNGGPPIIDGRMPSPSILIFSKTTSWRHNRGIAGADYFFVSLADSLGLNVFTTQNPAIFNDKDLRRFKLVVFNNVSGNVLSKLQQDTFQNWFENGGNLISVHSSGDSVSTLTNWPWFRNKIIGPRFIGHIEDPQFQEARVEVLNTDHPVMRDIPSEFFITDEWYSFDSTPQDHGLTPLAGIDESTYKPFNYVWGPVSDLRMGEGAINHPVIWSTCIKKGRALYTSIGHLHSVYSSEALQKILKNTYDWMIERKGQEGC
ncbi:ThuA domain-containing protein [Agarilytica rhodophyticola]|uniref:ThuA domain-containing protein n=1 Tax=Agarilytica rhodophyticola TaxID=1737490 RepID=UPI00131A0A2D|nr:ThuA domain-containing protein [Agarilytica rhodophyticola]